MWFEKLTGFKEESPKQVRSKLSLIGDELISSVNGMKYHTGKLETPSLGDLKERVSKIKLQRGQNKVSEKVADVQKLHADITNKHALFQAASQFNLLEMVGPHVVPEKGVDIYERDFTQGPACAISCGAGTIFRNYFVPLDGQIGQTTAKQIDCF
jgi:hypothetical protein